MFSQTVLLLVLATYFAVVKAIPTIEVVGSKFFTSDGNQFFIKGIAYQLIQDDPLVNTQQCQRDAALMQQLGANAIRVYHVNATADHTGCMNAFAAAGIYLFVDLDSFYTYIRYDVPSWTQDKSDSYRAVMDNFQQYDNTAGFFVGNEVLNGLTESGSAPYLLSAAADLKLYRDAKGYRKIPIGYSATDTAILRPMLQDYLVCRPNATERLDFYALNSYEWCGPKTYETSGYSQLQANAENYPVPIFLSEDGCNTVPPRDFQDQETVFSSPMVDTWSGAIIYEWLQETNSYGLIQYGPPMAGDVQIGSSVIRGFTREGTPTPIAPDFTNLQSQWATLTPTGVQMSAYAATVTTTPRSCPAYTAGGWTVDPSSALPTLGQAALSGMTSGLPSGIPHGSITVTGTVAPSTRSLPTTEGTSSSPLSASSSHTATTSSATTSTGAAARAALNPIAAQFDEAGMLRMAATLFTVCLGAMLWL